MLFNKLSQECLEILISKRNCYFNNYNQFLFPLCGTDPCISGYHVLRKHAAIALGDVSKASFLTSTRLRKHLATICQVLNMQNLEHEQLAKFTNKTHEEWYRLPLDIYWLKAILLVRCKVEILIKLK